MKERNLLKKVHLHKRLKSVRRGSDDSRRGSDDSGSQDDTQGPVATPCARGLDAGQALVSDTSDGLGR